MRRGFLSLRALVLAFVAEAGGIIVAVGPSAKAAPTRGDWQRVAEAAATGSSAGPDASG